MLQPFILSRAMFCPFCLISFNTNLSLEPPYFALRSSKQTSHPKILTEQQHVSYTPACVCVFVLVTQLCPTLWDPIDCSLPASSVLRILQARIQEWIVIPFSKGSSWPRNWTQISCTEGRFFTIWAASKAHTERPAGRTPLWCLGKHLQIIKAYPSSCQQLFDVISSLV